MRQVALLGAGLVVTLVAAYTVWTDDSEEREDSAIALYSATEGSLVSVTWTSDSSTATISQPTDAMGTYLWVEASTRTEIAVARPVDNDTDVDSDSDVDSDTDDDTQEVRYETSEGAFKGNEQASELWASFAPLYALRELSGATNTSAFGLEEPEATLTIEVEGETLQIDIGGETFGARDRYAKLGDRLFLVDDRALRPLQYATTRLVDRQLFPTAREDITSITVDLGDAQKTWTHGNPDDRSAEYWAPEGTDERDEAAKTWIGKLLRQSAQAYIDAPEVPVEPFLTYSIVGEQTWTIEVLRSTDDPEDPDFFARSPYNRSLVKLTKSNAADAFADVEELVRQ